MRDGHCAMYKKKDKKRKEQSQKREKEKKRAVGACESERENFFFFSLLLSKIYRNRTIGFRRSKKAKSIHASRATRGYQNLGVSSNSTR